jgi:hypothetical protein
MLDMEDVREDLSEHFGVVGHRITSSFRSQPTYLQYSEADLLITHAQSQPTQVQAVSRVKDRNYGTYSGAKQKKETIGKDKKYRIAKIEDKESPSPSSGQASSSHDMTQSTTSTSSFGINVRAIENDPINYRNPDV